MKFGLTMIPGIDWSEKLEREQDEVMAEYEAAKAKTKSRLEMTPSEWQFFVNLLETDPIFKPK